MNFNYLYAFVGISVAALFYFRPKMEELEDLYTAMSK